MVGYYIIVIAFHAVLTFEPIVSEVDVGLRALPTQIGEGSMFGGLVSPLANSLLGIAILMLLFMESGTAAISHMEYAASLPEESKRDPEYIRQFNNVVNSHLIQLLVIISLVGVTTALALAFDDLMISIVGILEGTQWTGQVKESLELQMTYGKVISAGLFIIAVAGLRFVVPWQIVSGYVESGIARLRSNKDLILTYTFPIVVAIRGMTVIRPQTVTKPEIAPMLGSIASSISEKASIPKAESTNRENLSIMGEKLLSPISLLSGRISELPMSLGRIVHESNHRRMI